MCHLGGSEPTFAGPLPGQDLRKRVQPQLRTLHSAKEALGRLAVPEPRLADGAGIGIGGTVLELREVCGLPTWLLACLGLTLRIDC